MPTQWLFRIACQYFLRFFGANDGYPHGSGERTKRLIFARIRFGSKDPLLALFVNFVNAVFPVVGYRYELEYDLATLDIRQNSHREQ
jgi:hypothetical protein